MVAATSSNNSVSGGSGVVKTSSSGGDVVIKKDGDETDDELDPTSCGNVVVGASGWSGVGVASGTPSPTTSTSTVPTQVLPNGSGGAAVESSVVELSEEESAAQEYVKQYYEHWYDQLAAQWLQDPSFVSIFTEMYGPPGSGLGGDAPAVPGQH
eukprot:Filipodium_phascolosomae@DN5933_c0_g1_i1.p2